MNVSLWVAASVLALGFFASGVMKLAQPREKVIASGQRWAEDFSPTLVKLIGTAEVLGAVALIMPPALDLASDLSPAAATGLALLMAGAMLVHLRRAETSKIATPATLVVCSAVLAALRFGPYGF